MPATLLDFIRAAIGTGWNPDVQMTGAQPDYGLTGAQILPAQRSPYEPGVENATLEDVRGSLGDLILAAGSAVVPGVGPRGTSTQAPARMRPGYQRQFKEWFGGSKITDEKGEPLTVYHGSWRDKPINSFAGPIHYFTDNPQYAAAYSGSDPGANIIPVHLRMTRPVDMRALGERKLRATEYLGHLEKSGVKITPELQSAVRSVAPAEAWFITAKARSVVRDALKASGFDGLIQRESQGGEKNTSYVTLEPTQIKSATGNVGTYSRESEDIRE